MNQVVILHGWSDTSRSFDGLAQFLRSNGYSPVPIWLGDYISMDDDVSVRDVAKRASVVIAELIAKGTLSAPFDMIVHSTGALVARQWITATYGSQPEACPVKRLVMLAPANFGSRLASVGQSLLGRVVKGWNNWFHTGKLMLSQLELASPFQWDLALKDLFVPPTQQAAPALYGDDLIWPFVIVGTHPYTSALRRIVNEDGADGTVRVPAANLNARGMTINFAANEADPKLAEWTPRHQDEIPFAVLPDRTHGSVINPGGKDINSTAAAQGRLGALILEALQCASPAAYRQVATKWDQISEETAALGAAGAPGDVARKALLGGGTDATAELFHQYMQIVVHVIDDHGLDVGDYFLEFLTPQGDPKDEATVYFHREVLEHVHTNKSRSALRCLYVDRTDLMNNYYGLIAAGAEKVLSMSISASPVGENVGYFQDYKKGAAASLAVHRADEDPKNPRWLRRNRTHLVQIVIPRVPDDSVFKLMRV